MTTNDKILSLADVREIERVKTYIAHADEVMNNYGYTEHGFRHAGLVAKMSGDVLTGLGFPEETVELARIAGYLHDIGNVVCRQGHEQIGAQLAETILTAAGMPYADVAVILNAIGNHEEDTGWTASNVGAAVIIADKADVHESRVRDMEHRAFDIHDRVNFASKHSELQIDSPNKLITLAIEIDTATSEVMEYFEIFLSRMEMCQLAAKFLGARFSLVINDVKLL
jgi:uncharacterized protein